MVLKAWFRQGGGKRRNSVWARRSVSFKEVQDLEARCLLSVTPVADEALLTTSPSSTTASIADPSLVQLSTVGTQEIINGIPTSQSSMSYGPTWMIAAGQAKGTPQTPAEDLYDEGAGAVWGSLSDEGGPSLSMVSNAAGAVGAMGIDDLLQDFGPVATGATGAAGVNGVYGNAYTGIDYVPADYGNGYMGVDDVGEEYNATGPVALGTIADEGVYGIVGGLDDVNDFGVGGYGGIDDVADYGAVTGSPTDGGIDSGIGVNGNDDYGAGAYGAGDYGAGVGDYGAEAGAGAGGTGTGGAAAVEVNIESIAPSFYEGPFTKRKLDRAAIAFSRTDLNTDGILESASIRVSFPDHSFPRKPYAILGEDFMVQTESGGLVTSMQDQDGLRSVLLNLNSVGGIDTFYLVSLTDSDHEDNEHIDVVITDASLHSVTATAKIGSKAQENTVLADATGDLDIDGLNEDIEDVPGADVLRNDDDDNQNEIPDFLELTSAQDDDLVPLMIKSYVLVPNDYFPFYYNGAYAVETEAFFVLTFDLVQISVTYDFAPNFEIEPGVTRINLGLGQSSNLLLEGLNAGVGTISLRWIVQQKDGQQVYADELFDTVKYTVWAADLDTNSDNTGGPLTAPDHSMWEDYIEDHPYGLGVIIYPDEYYNPPGYPHFPFNELQLATYSVTNSSWYDQDKQGISFDWEATGNSGTLKVFSMPGDVLGGLKKWSLESGGHELTPGRVYSSAELAVAAQDGRFIPGKLWLQGDSPASQLNQFHSIEQNGKQDDFIEAVGYVDRDSGWKKTVSDRIKYLIATPNTFYPHLQWDIDPLPDQELPPIFEPGHAGRSEVLRDAMASGAVYTSGADKKEFALKLQDAPDLLRLGVSPGIVNKIIAAGSSNSGLQLSVYRDYASVGAPVVLAFRGTDDAMDGLDNLFQGLGGLSFQYSDAIAIGAAVAAAPGVRGVGLRITGHSLGGGLASAALVAARAVDANSSAKLAYLHCNTFNAAGLHSNSLYVNNDPTQAQRVPGIRAAYDSEVGGVGAIDAWFLRYDILSFVQDNARGMSKAIGKRHRMAGPKISPIDAQLIDELAKQIQVNFEGNSLDDLITFLHRSSPATGANFWDVHEILFNSHKTSFYYFGLMVIPNFEHPDDGYWWDIYGDNTIHF